jgi:hypothetical protein
MVSPQAKRVAVAVLMTERSFGVTRACGLVGISRSLYRYRSRRPDSAPLRARIEEIAAIKRRYGSVKLPSRLATELATAVGGPTIERGSLIRSRAADPQFHAIV